MVKNPPANAAHPLEKEIVIRSNILAWRRPWTEEPGGLQFMGSQRDVIEHFSAAVADSLGTLLT